MRGFRVEADSEFSLRDSTQEAGNEGDRLGRANAMSKGSEGRRSGEWASLRLM